MIDLAIHKIINVGDIIDQMGEMEYLLSSAALENEMANRGISYGLSHLSDLIRLASAGLDEAKADLIAQRDGGAA